VCESSVLGSTWCQRVNELLLGLGFLRDLLSELAREFVRACRGRAWKGGAGGLGWLRGGLAGVRVLVVVEEEEDGLGCLGHDAWK